MSKKVEYEISGKCMICTSHATNSEGYPVIWSDGKTKYLHRVVYAEKHGVIKDGFVIRHTCDRPACINPNHLICGTHADNVRDRVSRRRSAKGTRNGRAKLSNKDVLFIYRSNKPNMSLSRDFEVDPKVIRNIKQGKTWGSITIPVQSPLMENER